MLSNAQRLRMSDRILSVSSKNPFGRYKREKIQEVRKSDIQESEGFQKLKQAFETWMSDKFWKRKSGGLGGIIDYIYPMAVKLIRGLEYSAKDVEKLCIAIAEFQQKEDFANGAGVFLSAVINNGKEESYTIETRHLTEAPNYLCYRNKKRITIEGNVGEYVGCAQSGEILVNGNADDYVGRYARAGKITINGNVVFCAGANNEGCLIEIKGNSSMMPGVHMKNGRVIVRGNVETSAGDGMKGGTLEIFGNINGSVGSEMEGGKIIVHKNAGERNHGYFIALEMHGGEIHLNGRIFAQIMYDRMTGGKIYKKGKLIFERKEPSYGSISF